MQCTSYNVKLQYSNQASVSTHSNFVEKTLSSFHRENRSCRVLRTRQEFLSYCPLVRVAGEAKNSMRVIVHKDGKNGGEVRRCQLCTLTGRGATGCSHETHREGLAILRNAVSTRSDHEIFLALQIEEAEDSWWDKEKLASMPLVHKYELHIDSNSVCMIKQCLSGCT